jgi:hypothetical protein
MGHGMKKTGSSSVGGGGDRTGGRKTAGDGGGRSVARKLDEATTSSERLGTAEHLTRDLARVRAKFGMDPVLAPRSLELAWTSSTASIEEDEAEFVDAMADCLGAGLSLDAALDCWDSGDLATDTSEDSSAGDDESGATLIPIAVSSARHAPGRRLLVR